MLGPCQNASGSEKIICFAHQLTQHSISCKHVMHAKLDQMRGKMPHNLQVDAKFESLLSERQMILLLLKIISSRVFRVCKENTPKINLTIRISDCNEISIYNCFKSFNHC